MKIQPKEYLAERPFLQMPLEIWNSELSLHAKCLYMTLMNRGKLSEINGHQDEEGVYAFCTIEQAAKELSCKRDKAMKTFRELEEAGLIVRVKRGAMRSNYYYLRGTEKTQEQVVSKSPELCCSRPQQKAPRYQPAYESNSSFVLEELEELIRMGGSAPKVDIIESTKSTVDETDWRVGQNDFKCRY